MLEIGDEQGIEPHAEEADHRPQESQQTDRQRGPDPHAAAGQHVDLSGAAARVRGREQVHRDVDPLGLETGPQADVRLQGAGHHPHPQCGGQRLERQAEEDQSEIGPMQPTQLGCRVADLDARELVPEDPDGQREEDQGAHRQLEPAHAGQAGPGWAPGRQVRP